MPTTYSLHELRSFGLLVGGMFAFLGVWPLWWHGVEVRWWALGVAGMLILSALGAPRLLRPIYRVWMVVGAGLGWVNTRILLGSVFFALLTPMGVIRRIAVKKDPLQLTRDPHAETYRVVRQPRAPSHVQRPF